MKTWETFHGVFRSISFSFFPHIAILQYSSCLRAAVTTTNNCNKQRAMCEQCCHLIYFVAGENSTKIAECYLSLNAYEYYTFLFQIQNLKLQFIDIARNLSLKSTKLHDCFTEKPSQLLNFTWHIFLKIFLAIKWWLDQKLFLPLELWQHCVRRLSLVCIRVSRSDCECVCICACHCSVCVHLVLYLVSSAL